MRSLLKPGRVFYGWWIVIGSTIVSALQAGVYFYGFSAFFTPLVNEFGWSRTALSGAFSVARLEAGIAGPVVGFLIDKLGPRKLMMCGLSMVGVGFVLLSKVNSIEMFYIVFVLVMSVGSSMGGGAPAHAAVANWFVRRRGFALGVVACGVGIGGLAVPVVAWGIEQFGWRNAAIGCGILFLASGIPLAMIMRHRPEPYGYLPDGGNVESDKGTASENSAKAPPRRVVAEANFTAKEAIRTNAFWVIALAFTFRQLVASGIGVHVIAALQNINFSAGSAAAVLAAMTMSSIPGRIFFGWLGDRIDKRYVLASILSLQSLGLVAFAFATDIKLIIVFLLVYAPAYGGAVPLMPAMWAEYFGRRNFASIAGLAQSVTMWGTIVGPLMAGYTYDVTNSYQFAFLFYAASSITTVTLLFFIRKPKAKSVPEVVPTA